MDSLRPDIALLQHGKVIAAIEICVTHAVNREKAQRLQQDGIDWIELHGREGIYEEPGAWKANEPLVPTRQHPVPPIWLCAQCQKIQRQQEYEHNNRVEIFCARMIDLYYQSGKKYREVFYVKQAFTHGKRSRIWIEDEHHSVIAEERAPITEQSQQRLNEAFRRKHQELKQKAVLVDDEMDWTRWLLGQRFVPRDTDSFPFRYAWHREKKTWVLQPQLRWKQLG